jgi:hypothetical protein
MSKGSVFRVDKFLVPEAARDTFLAQVGETHAFLGAQPGCLRNLVLEKDSGPGRFNVVTFVEWESDTAFENAKAAMASRRETTGFDPAALIARLGVETDLAAYRLAEAPDPID